MKRMTMRMMSELKSDVSDVMTFSAAEKKTFVTDSNAPRPGV